MTGAEQSTGLKIMPKQKWDGDLRGSTLRESWASLPRGGAVQPLDWHCGGIGEGYAAGEPRLCWVYSTETNR